MQPLTQLVDVIIERVPLNNRWANERWQPAAVEIVPPCAGVVPDRSAAPGTLPCIPEGQDRWRCRGFEIELHPTEAEGYFLNLTAPNPRIFVMWRLFDDGAMPVARPVLVTVSYNQAARFMDGGEQVDGVPMVPAIADWMRPFIAAHYRPEPRRKAKRNDPLGDATPHASSEDSRRG
ncbi:MAG TPA: DUF3305 domain-containing protein [Casimicrobiaceae bacterium]|nr:DUF3305 domain-containing protein [Casimicrobiaceae bacterium]